MRKERAGHNYRDVKKEQKRMGGCDKTIERQNTGERLAGRKVFTLENA